MGFSGKPTAARRLMAQQKSGEFIVALDQRLVPDYSMLRDGVHQISAHHHVINIVPKGRPDFLLALVDRHVPPGPRQLRCHALPAADADLANCLPNVLPPVFSCTLQVPHGNLDGEIIESCWHVLEKAATFASDLFTKTLHKRLQQGIAALQQALQGRYGLDGAVCGLLGLGQGLTPSGDDFLCGLIITLHLPQSPYHESLHELCTALQRHLHRTHAISAAFIRDALHGEVSAPVQDFICLLYGNHAGKGERDRIIHALTALGHSSGYDLLSGILAGLSFHSKRSATLCPCIAN